MSSPVIKPLLFDTYLAMINNAVGSQMFKNGYAEFDGVKKDVVNDGELSCAIFVSSILKIFSLIDEPHATVKSTVVKMEAAGWQKTEELKPGCVLVWEEKVIDGQPHFHIGFYVGDNEAVSNSTEAKVIAKHHYTYGVKNGEPIRKIMSIYYHSSFIPL